MLEEAAAKRSRQHLTLGVIVPEGIAACWKAGIDIKSWIDRNLVDYIIVSTWNETDLQLPVEEFATLADGTGIPVLAMMGNLIMGGGWITMPKITGRGTGQFRETYGGMLITVPEARACAANYYAWGADGIAFWNVGCHMGPVGSRVTAQPEYWEQMWLWMKTVLDRDRLYEGERCYHYIPNYKNLELQGPQDRNYAYFIKGLSPLGAPKYSPLEFHPSDITTGKPFHFRMADGRNGEMINGSMRFWFYNITLKDSVSVALNEKSIKSTYVHKYPAGVLRQGIPGVRFEIDLVNYTNFRGDNELKITLHTFPDTEDMPFVEELEVFIQ